MIHLPVRAALLLDLDGTLIDIAPTPDSVIVPPGLPGVLTLLRDRLGGALAIVTGRPIAQVDALLPGVPTAIAGEHGGVIRHAPGALEQRSAAEPPPQRWLDAAEALAADYPGSLVERKQHGFVLHFRQAPTAGPAFGALLASLVADSPGHVLGEALMAWELKPIGIDKGGAVRALMTNGPFAGRVPVFVGDDVTDEDGIRAARALGGVGLRVQDHFTDAEGVRAWLSQLAQTSAEINS